MVRNRRSRLFRPVQGPHTVAVAKFNFVHLFCNVKITAEFVQRGRQHIVNGGKDVSN